MRYGVYGCWLTDNWCFAFEWREAVCDTEAEADRLCNELNRKEKYWYRVRPTQATKPGFGCVVSGA